MSTIAPPTKPLPAALVDSEQFIDAQIRRTRRSLKLVDLAAGLITLLIGMLAFVLLAAVLDHWVFPGGLSPAGRLAVFGLMLAAVAWYGWRQFVPLLRPINPVYAAQTIERSSPSLKNSLLNLLLFRTHRSDLSARVYHALEQQAAQRLSTAAFDASIDRSALLRLGYALLLVIAVCAAYSVLSPKDMVRSAARVLAPWSDLSAPSRVQIMNIRPGDVAVARGERVEIEATIAGLREGETARVHYSTDDEQRVDESVAMKTPDAGLGRFVAELPRPGDAAVDSGVQQALAYWIEAGDARSNKFNVTVFARPTLVVQRVQYAYPAYTGFPSAEVDSTGDVRGLEGTQVTIAALANQPIKSAYVDFDADGRNDLRMTVDGDRATASFTLALRDDRRTPQHGSYVLRFTTTEGRSNVDPPKYRIEVSPDYAPEVRIVSPEEPERTVRLDEMVPIELEARDPDFALSSVRLQGKVGDREATLAEPLTEKHEGRLTAIKPLTPGQLKLKAGDVLEYWAEARDNRRPDANVSVSERRRLKITGPAEGAKNPDQAPGGAAGQQQKPSDGESGEAGDQGQAGPQQTGESQDGDADSGGEQGQQGPGGAGGQGKQQNNSQDQGATGGGGESGEAEASDSPPQPSDGSGGAGDGESKPQPGDSAPTESAAPGASPDGPNPNANAQPGGNEAGEPGGEPSAASGGEPQEKTPSDGSDDTAAFKKLTEKLNPQPDGESDPAADGSPAPSGEQQPQSPPADGAAENEGEAAPPKPGDSGKPGENGDATSSADPSQQGETGEQPQPDAPEGTDANQPKTSPKAQATPNGKPAEGAKQPPGDGAQGEPKSDGGAPGESQPQDPSGEASPNDRPGDTGAGQGSDKPQGTPADPNQKPTDKPPRPDGKQGPADEQPPPGASTSKKESDSEGAQSGDRSGGGKEGPGQQADAPGQGESGENQPADDGGSQSAEQGDGPPGAKAGGEQTADGKTGQSSGKQPGAGEQQQPSSDAGAKGDQAAGAERAEASAKPGDSAAGKPSAGAGDPAGAQPPSDPSAPSPSEGQPDSPAGKKGDPQAPRPPAGNTPAGAATPDGGGPGGVGDSTARPEDVPDREDEVNLEFARQQTDLVIERLDEQLAKKKVDPELLKSLGWSEAELRQFVDRWKGLKTRAADKGESGEKAQQELDGALRSLGLRPREAGSVRAGSKTDKLRVDAGPRARAPVEYADRVREYAKGVAAGEK